jgi:hypothetical protein
LFHDLSSLAPIGEARGAAGIGNVAGSSRQINRHGVPSESSLEIASPWAQAYNSQMMDATQPGAEEDWREHAFDLARGIAVFTGSPLVKGVAKVIARHPQADIGNAFNHKQVACKMWARDRLLESAGGVFGEIWIVGGWYGVLAGMLLEDERFKIGRIENSDIDPEVGRIAETLNQAHHARFDAVTADMYALDYGGRRPDLVVNTSCEHIPDLRAWLSRMARGQRVLLQSNDYFSEPTHIACVPSLQAFEELAGLSNVEFAGELPMKKYTRFMLIGRV